MKNLAFGEIYRLVHFSDLWVGSITKVPDFFDTIRRKSTARYGIDIHMNAMRLLIIICT